MHVWQGSGAPFTRGWRGPAATTVQCWMSLMRNDIPALTGSFLEVVATLSLSDG